MKTKTQCLLILLFFAACTNDDHDAGLLQAYGTFVVNLQTAMNPHACGPKIVLDNGENIIPNNASSLSMVSGDRVWVEYEVTQKQSSCEGTDCNILNYEVVECKPYVDLYFYNQDSLKRDKVSINEVRIEDDCLMVNLSYSGGCADHLVDLARIHPSCGTPPLPPPTFEIRHDSNGDECEAWITETVRFDLSPLKDEFDNDVDIILTANTYEENSYTENLTFEIN